MSKVQLLISVACRGGVGVEAACRDETLKQPEIWLTIAGFCSDIATWKSRESIPLTITP